MKEEATEIGSRIRTAGAKRDLRIRSRTAIQESQDRKWRPARVDACPGEQVIQDRKRRGRIGC